MWFRRPRVEDMPPEDDHLSGDQLAQVADEQVAEYEGAQVLAEQAYQERGTLPDHPDISADALLAWHSQIRRAGIAEREYDAMGPWEFVPDPEVEEPEPQVVAGTPPTLRDKVRATKDVWVPWWRGKILG